MRRTSCQLGEHQAGDKRQEPGTGEAGGWWVVGVIRLWLFQLVPKRLRLDVLLFTLV